MARRQLALLILTVLLFSCEPGNTPPVASVYSIPEIGDSTTIFMLEGKNSTDEQTGYYALKYRWDTDADGNWDSDYSSQTSYAARFSGTGYKKYIMEVTDDDGACATTVDSVFLLSQNPYIDTLTDPRDGKKYRIVKIGENWWMAENLHYGIPIRHTLPQTNNNQVEFYYLHDDAAYESYGGLYTWDEACNYPSLAAIKNICPPGWKIPSPDQWSALFNAYQQPFDILYYFGPSSVQNLGIEMSGYYRYGDPDHAMEGEFIGSQSSARYWTSTFTGQDSTRYFTGMDIQRDSWSLVTSFNRAEWIYHSLFGYIIGYRTPEACYVRCVKE